MSDPTSRRHSPFAAAGIAPGTAPHETPNDEANRHAIKDADSDIEDDYTVSTASSSSSVESLASPAQHGGQTYPTQRSAGRKKGMLSANGHYRDSPNRSTAKLADESSEDDIDGKELLDEEERVGLMLDERGKHKTARWQGEPAKKGSAGQALSSKLKPLLLMLAVTLSLLALLPALRWLSTATSGDDAQQNASVLSTKAHHLVEVVMPDYWRLPESPRPTSHIRKPKRPLPSGTKKLTSFGGPFAMNFEVPVEGPQGAYQRQDQKTQITMDDALGGKFMAERSSLRWSAEDPDEGVFMSFSGHGDVVLEDVTHLRHDLTGEGEIAKGGGKVVLARGEDIKMANGTRLFIDDVSISPDMRYLLVFTDRKAQYRHSSKSQVWIHDIGRKSTTQLGSRTNDSSIDIALWSKQGAVAFVEENDIYLIRNAGSPSNAERLTTTGSTNVFNGVPDWAYEEEVFEGDTTMWWSIDGNRLVWLTLNETLVHEYKYPYYNPTQESEHALIYPEEKKIKYPKPGTPNPVVDVFMYDVQASKKYELREPPGKTIEKPEEIDTQVADDAMRLATGRGNEALITEVKWLNDTTLAFRETNRISDAMRWLIYDCANPTTDDIIARVGARMSTSSSGGWIPTNQDVRRIGDSAESTAHVDLIAEKHGYRHIAYYASATQVKPVYLTAGEWEVDAILFIGNGKIYFSAAYPRPSVRHILYVDIPPAGKAEDVQPVFAPAALTNVAEDAWYSASFDPKGGYYTLQYDGPHIPWTKVLSLRDKSFELLLEDNADLSRTVATYVQPQRVFYNITTTDGIVVSAQEIRPHDFDGTGSTRYPALLKVYGGPDSQVVQAKWSMPDWATYLTCTLGYIVILVDGRGTGYRGRDYRDPVTWRLGDAEATDVIGAAEAIRRLPYISQSRVGIWGWSYGGYLTAKVIERDSGTFDLGMSVAPVTRWEFYDSIYTERYMKTPQKHNKYGYNQSAIHVTKGFENSHYLLAQGSGDDNVHYQNSAHLLDMLTQHKIRGFWFRMFTDSRHNMQVRGAYRELHEFMTRFLVYNWGAGGQRVFHYAKHKEQVERRGDVAHELRELRAPVVLETDGLGP